MPLRDPDEILQLPAPGFCAEGCAGEQETENDPETLNQCSPMLQCPPDDSHPVGISLDRHPGKVALNALGWLRGPPLKGAGVV